MNKIDIIFPYVDCNDHEWQKLYYENIKKYKKIDRTWDDWATGMKRFRPNGMLKYVFRGIAEYVPWVNKVYMIVQSESQIPNWINRDEVNIVYHSDFIPQEYLPTFNSSTIEMFIHNIKDLSEYFIYGNDDTIFTSPIMESDFFDMKNDKLIFGVKYRRFNFKWTGDMLRKSDYILLRNSFNGYIYSFQHTYLPHKKSIMIEVFNKYKKKILSTVTPFRTQSEHNQWIFSQYAYFNNKVIKNRLSYMSTEIKTKNMQKILLRNWSKYKSVCFNDHSSTTDTQVNEILSKFEKTFPNKCKYEL